jgi:CheY-like chemotaxis protein
LLVSAIRYRTGGWVLLVDDEPSIRRLAERILSSSGHTGFACGSGAEALDLAANDDGFDLLVTDIIMPEMMGHELARRLRKRNPKLRVLLVSGYSHDVSDEPASEELDRFLAKPFTAAQLRESVREALEHYRRSTRSHDHRGLGFGPTKHHAVSPEAHETSGACANAHPWREVEDRSRARSGISSTAWRSRPP